MRVPKPKKKVKKKKFMTFEEALAKKQKADAKRALKPKKKKKRKRRKLSTVGRLEIECDNLTREITFIRDWRTCQKSGLTQLELYVKGSKLDPHHVIGRGRKILRWYVPNIISLSRKAHNAQRFHKNDFLFWFAEHYPKRFKLIMKKRNEFFDQNIESMKKVRASLRRQLTKIKRERGIT